MNSQTIDGTPVYLCLLTDPLTHHWRKQRAIEAIQGWLTTASGQDAFTLVQLLVELRGVAMGKLSHPEFAAFSRNEALDHLPDLSLPDLERVLSMLAAMELPKAA